MTFLNYLCTENELFDRLDRQGEKASESQFHFIEHASSFLLGLKGLRGNFIPWTQTRYFDGNGQDTIKVPDLLTVSALELDGTALTEGISDDFYLIGEDILRPYMGNGFYSRIRKYSGVWTRKNAVIKVTGEWGKWNETEVMAGETITLTDSGTTLTGGNGSLYSPGLHNLIEDEQIVVTAIDPTVVAATSLTNGALTLDADSVTVDDASEFNTGEIIQIELEDMKIIKINTATNQLAVLRGYNKTFKTTHADDTAIGVYRKFTIKRGINGTTAAEHTSKAISKYNIPGDVKELAIALAGKALKIAETNYANREANAELGETFYYSLIPHREIKQVRLNWYR